MYRIVINTQTRPDGSTHTVVNSLATGTAIDNAGGAYHFNYHNHSSEDVATGGFPIQLRFNDHFNLGRIESTLERRIGHRLDPRLANVGRLLWFDTITGLNNDNTCAGCHSPTNGFGDTQSIAIGIQNNGIVGPDRAGPHNERRAPMVINTAFFPNLMWNSRFVSRSGDPFDNSAGFQFPAPEGLSLSYQPQLLVAQAFIPPIERTEVTGFAFPGDHFEFTLTFANAPIDRFARGEPQALTSDETHGALLFFGKAGCVSCHAVSGPSNEMFSDFQDHNIGVPQIVPRVTNNQFDGPDATQDFGREEITGNPQDRYKFRTSPLRNVAVQPAFMHNGAFTSLTDAIRRHLNVVDSALHYTPASQHLASGLGGPTGPITPVVAGVDPLVATPITLTSEEFGQLVAFVRDGLLDPRPSSSPS